MLRLALLAGLLCSAHADMSWVRGGGDNALCAGVESTCDSIDTCTLTAYGLCSSVNGTADSKEYISSSFVGLAFVKEGYLTDADKMKVVDPDTSATNGYRDFKGDEKTEDGGEYAFTMTGGRFGDMKTVGGYVGVASYLNTGKKDIKTNTAKIFTSDDTKTKRKDNGYSANGAPIGPMDVCISEVSGGKCGAKRTFTPGEYKFSIFGWTKGDNYPPKKGEGGFPDYTHLGVRMKLKANGFKVDQVKVNGDKTLATIGSTNVTSITVTSGTKTLKIAFPKKYNYGDVLDGSVNVPDGTKTVGIKVSNANVKGEDSMFIDYLFDETDINKAKRYFIYDPDVTAVTGSGFSSALSLSGVVASLLGAAAAAFA